MASLSCIKSLAEQIVWDAICFYSDTVSAQATGLGKYIISQHVMDCNHCDAIYMRRQHYAQKTAWRHMTRVCLFQTLLVLTHQIALGQVFCVNQSQLLTTLCA